jgi:hypothetical protein
MTLEIPNIETIQIKESRRRPRMVCALGFERVKCRLARALKPPISVKQVMIKPRTLWIISPLNQANFMYLYEKSIA